MSPAITNGKPITSAASIGDSEREDVFGMVLLPAYS